MTLDNAIRHTLLKLGSAANATDGQLLARFAATREQTAFEELLRRHGRMVQRVCQRVLRHAQDAEDAFQATFIVLMHKARAIAKYESVASWLYGVAYRVAQDARRNASRRHAYEKFSAETVFEDNHQSEDGGRDLCRVLDEALHCLPEKYRAVIVFCYFEGNSTEEAARLLRCRSDAVRKRLERARELLRDRLTRRGLVVSSGALAAMLARETAAGAVPAALGAAVVRSSMSSTVGTMAPPAVLALADAVSRTPLGTRVKLGVVLIAITATFGASAALLVQPTPQEAHETPVAVGQAAGPQFSQVTAIVTSGSSSQGNIVEQCYVSGGKPVNFIGWLFASNGSSMQVYAAPNPITAKIVTSTATNQQVYLTCKATMDTFPAGGGGGPISPVKLQIFINLTSKTVPVGQPGAGFKVATMSFKVLNATGEQVFASGMLPGYWK